jgi:hypothetical protein
MARRSQAFNRVRGLIAQQICQVAALSRYEILDMSSTIRF